MNIIGEKMGNRTKQVSDMNLPSRYLDLIQAPTTDDFNNFFRILLLELQWLANCKKWKILNPNNFSYFAYSCDNDYEVGVELVLLSYEGEEFPFGVKCKIYNGYLQFYIFESKGIFDNKPYSTGISETETYIKGGYTRTYECFIEYLDNISQQISEMIQCERIALKRFKLPDYKIQDIQHIDECKDDNTEIPF